MKLKGRHFAGVADIQEAVTDKLKRNFRQLFRNFTTAQKLVYMPMELILNKKNARVFLMCLRVKKKSVLKFWTAIMYIRG
jgi:hypothetical protein